MGKIARRRPRPVPIARNQLLSWAPPALTSPTTVQVDETGVAVGSMLTVTLTGGGDHIVQFPTNRAIPRPVTIDNSLGRHVVIIGGEINLPDRTVADPTGTGPRRAMFLKPGSNGNIIHVEGMRFRGDLNEGYLIIGSNPDRGDVTVQIQNQYIDGLFARDQVNFTDNHDDLIQIAGGPGLLRVDRFTGWTDYQGLYLQPSDFGGTPDLVDLRRVDLHAQPTARYLLYQAATNQINKFPVSCREVWLEASGTGPYIDANHAAFPQDGRWDGLVNNGPPPGGSFVDPATVGIGYVSPGYVT